MGLKELKIIAKEVIRDVQSLGFDELTIRVTESSLLAVRVALGTVCRENVAASKYGISVWASKDKSNGMINFGALNKTGLMKKVIELRKSLDSQSPDNEYFPGDVKPGSFTHRLADKNLFEVYPPEVLYPVIESHIKPIRDRGLRVTGYVEGNGTDSHLYCLNGHDYETHDVGVTFTFTVDDQKTGASGVGKGATISGGENQLNEQIGIASKEAERICVMGKDPGEVEPGDYSVILSPSATYDIVQTAFMYGLFDRRKIDEGRAYLSGGKVKELKFPKGLKLFGSQVTSHDDGEFKSSRVNYRNVECEDLTFIGDGRIQDLLTCPFWAREKGLKETFGTESLPLQLSCEENTEVEIAKDTEALIAGTKKGIFVNDTWYLRMVAEMDGTVTGMTRDGVFEIEDGKITRPLKNMRWHENPIRVLSAISGIASEKKFLGLSSLAGRGRYPLAYLPAIKVDNFHFSSVTKF